MKNATGARWASHNDKNCPVARHSLSAEPSAPIPDEEVLVSILKPLGLALALSLACASAPLEAAHAQAEAPHPVKLSPVSIDAPIVTSHQGVFNGKAVRYRAVVEPFLTLDLAGKPAARLVATSYIADDAAPDRPVLFVFNGGPISATTPLHMGMFGPKRLAIPDDITADPRTFKVVDNVYSPLDVADVVIFDPANTGYSRTLPGVDPASQFSTKADSRQLAQLVQGWIKAHHRQGSPIYLVGESYGTMRAPEAAHQLQQTDTPVSGLFLLGQAVNIIEYAQRRDNIISYAVSLPTLAAIGWWHGKVERKGRSFDRFIADARDYGAGEYLSVLFLGNRAPLARKRAVARKLQEFTGLSAETFLKADLKVAKTRYQRELIPGAVLDTYDARYLDVPGGRGPAIGYDAAAVDHFHSFLNVPAEAGVYSTAMPDLGYEWEFADQKTPFGDWPWVKYVRDLMTGNPRFRVFVGNGYYDTQTTIGAMDYLAAQSGWPMDRVRTRYFQGGHMMYTVEASAKAVGEEVRAMVTRQW
jgi:carboxypeptidase C (cathepsin A)